MRPSLRRPLLPFALALGLSLGAPPSGARAEEPAAADPQAQPKQPQLTKMPVLKHFVEAPYPPEAEKARLEGKVLLEIDIGADGKVGRCEVLEPAGHGFDEAAAQAVRQFEFEPAEFDDVPVPVRLTYRYEFVLRAPPPPPPSDEPAEKKPAGIVVIEGRLLERGTRVPMKSAAVYAEKDGETQEAVADDEGRFALKDLALGTWKLTVRAPGYEPYVTSEDVRQGEVAAVTYYVRRKSNDFEATVRARREKKEVARRTLTLEEIQKIPGTNGDAIRVVQNLPGVARTPLGLGPIVVRGGRPGDTRTYIDGQLVPLLFHFGGLMSVINSDFLDTLDFYPGNYPVRYGRSIAGAVDVNTRAGNRERTRGYANINLTETTLFLEGPLTKSGSFMASVRRSYIDSVLPVLLYFTGNPGADFRVARYWDYQLKADFDVGKNKLSFFLFGSDDKLDLLLQNPEQVSPEGRSNIYSGINFHRLTSTWKRKLTDGLDHRLSLTLGVDDTINAFGSDIFFQANLKTAAVREELTLQLGEKVTLLGGADLFFTDWVYGLQGPPPPQQGEVFNPSLGDNLQTASDTGFTSQPALFVDAIYKPFAGLKLVPGVRLDYDSYLKRAWVDPRITAFYELNEKLLFKASAGLYHQPPTPEKLIKVFGNPSLFEEGSAQYAAGVEWKFAELLSVDLQVYYKDIFGEATRGREAAQGQEGQDLNSGLPYTNKGQGRAYGAELLVKRDPGKGLFGWVALSLGQAERRSGDDQPWVQSQLNQRYNLVAVLSYKLPYDLEAGARVRITDGNPNTPQQLSIYDVDSDTTLPIASLNRRSERLPAFFQLDVRIDRKWVFEKWILNTYLDVQNVTWHDNVEGYSYNYDFTQRRPFTGLPLFPSFGVRGEF